MLFDFQSYIEELRENPEKKEIIEKYEKFFGTIEWDIKDQIWYKEYVYKFQFIQYLVPEELKEDFDWDLLMQLVASSLSSEWFLDFVEWSENPEFTISVQSWDQVVVKKVSELWGFQILRLYEIYLEEQMNLQILIAEDEKERDAIMQQRDSKFNRWGIVLENLQKNKLEAADKAEREWKLSDLMSQL